MYKEYKVRVYDSGGVHWYNSDGQYHREDGPAIEDADGYKEWWINGLLHREDGPAYEGANGYKEWWINGKRHRTDGPAVEHADGDKVWYLNGEELTEEEFNKRLATCDGKVVEVDGKKYELKLVE